MAELDFPRSIDIFPTASCNLRCSFCWGPEHNIPDALDTDGWKKVISFFSSRGTNAVVFSGGEPLIREDISELIRFSKGVGMRVTLSTNVLLLRSKAPQILPFIDEIGIPIDGANTKQNAKMRLGNTRAFSVAINALHIIKPSYPHIEVTVRTVVSKVNRGEVERVGELLEAQRGLFDRWKLYHFAAVGIGENYGEEHEVTLEEFLATTDSLKKRFASLNIKTYPNNNRRGKYVFIGSDGNIIGVGEHGENKVVGNFIDASEDEIMTSIRDLHIDERNDRVAQLRQR